MDRRSFNRAATGLMAGVAGLFASSAKADTPQKQHRIVFQVSGGDAGIMNMVLNNAKNAVDYYSERREPVQIEIVAFGPGYLMLRDNSPMRFRIAEMRQKFPSIVFSACQNSRRAVAREEGKKLEEIIELPEATDVPAGVVRVNELQEAGWSYIRP
jgi:intracellular sulfur oxidation DsrE/DsrF family protein